MGHPSLLCVTFLAWTCVLLYAVTSLPLDDYVNKPDDHYNYTLLKQIHEENYTVHILNMTSQKWMDEDYTDSPIWWHYLMIVVPKQIYCKDTAYLMIGGGNNYDDVPDASYFWLKVLAEVAVASQTVTAMVKQVPNGPVIFKSDPSRESKRSDETVAWAWKQFMSNPSQPEALVHLPMTKAVVRAMDTIDSYSQETRQQAISKFFLTGYSKRGWTTWLTSAVDSRIIGMAPMVGDFLNLNEALSHHYRSLGGWSLAMKDYRIVVTSLGSKAFNQTADIIDPLMYKDRYKNIPTYIVKASGDQFILPDATQYYYNQLSQPRHIRVVPNTAHSLGLRQANSFFGADQGANNFYINLLHGFTFPKIRWTMASSNTSGTIHVTMDTEPLTLTVYQADTLLDGRRDFRWWQLNTVIRRPMFHPVWWSKGQATKLTPTEYEATVQKPPFGWSGFFIEMTFHGVNNSTLAFTTEVNVVPNTFPFPDCRPKCGTNLV